MLSIRKKEYKYWPTEMEYWRRYCNLSRVDKITAEEKKYDSKNRCNQKHGKQNIVMVRSRSKSGKNMIITSEWIPIKKKKGRKR